MPSDISNQRPDFCRVCDSEFRLLKLRILRTISSLMYFFSIHSQKLFRKLVKLAVLERTQVSFYCKIRFCVFKCVKGTYLTAMLFEYITLHNIRYFLPNHFCNTFFELWFVIVHFSQSVCVFILVIRLSSGKFV